MAASTVEKGVLWTGSDDGLVFVTREGGKNWENVSPDLPPDSDVYEVEASPHDAATAYIAVSRYRTANDFKPCLFKTDDYGKTWKKISNTFPQDEITRTIREDTVRKGLLFVGTETGIFVSINDGASWDRFNINMPAVPVHDIKVKDEDLAIATFGRGFWILDDISPLRQMEASMLKKSAHLFKPRTTVRLGKNWWAAYGGGVGGGQKNYFAQNGRQGHTFYELGIVKGEKKRKFIDAGDARPDGAIIYYALGKEVKDVSLTILEADGKEIKTFSGDAISKDNGLNRFVWDMLYPDAISVPGKPPAGIVVQARPGTYQVRMTVDGMSQTESFEIKMNPNEPWTQADADARFELWMRVRSITEKANLAIIEALKLAEEAKKAARGNQKAEALAEKIDQAATEFSGSLVPVGTTLSAIANEPAKLLSKLQTVHHVLFSSEGRPPQSAYDVVKVLSAEIDARIGEWNRVVERDVAEFNRMK